LFGDFGLRHTFQERIAPKSPDTDQDNTHIKFSALNIDFNGLGFATPYAQEGRRKRALKMGTPSKCALPASQRVADARYRLHPLANVDAKLSRTSSYRMSFARIGEHRLLYSRPSYMHRCRAFSLR